MNYNKKPENLLDWMELANQRVLQHLSPYLPNTQEQPSAFNQSLHYVMHNGGKRLRPTLVYMTAAVLGGQLEHCDPAACAVELIHTYSLVHDDLPAMDNDDFRRGKPSCHCAFTEAVAILAGDALQTLAFEILSEPSCSLDDAQRLKMIHTLAKASGLQGMCKGQALDMQYTKTSIPFEALKEMHACKTGALIKASILLGGLSLKNIDQNTYNILDQFADHLGFAFQVQDDILDIVGNTAILGKPQGSDEAQGKMTIPAILGLEESKKLAHELCESSKKIIRTLNFNSQPLCNLADYIVNRVA
ncbi:MAG TPA: farnesyl diphosphate synthase [Gammaproteobacteria bacterium]|nr:farnesyl diphosphate synthase [Gammaproteobacteria bacterium]